MFYDRFVLRGFKFVLAQEQFRMADDPYAKPTRAEEVEDAFRHNDPWQTVDDLATIVSDKYGEPGMEDVRPSFAELIPALILMLDEQVRNGGFHQFLTNPSGDLCIDVMTALRKVDAVETILLLEQASSVFPDQMPSTDHMTRCRQVEAAGEDARHLLYGLDQPFYDLEETLFTQTRDYLRQHKDEFIEE